ncbi:MAG: gas vesicle protein GvpO [Jatrophihabitantaceae bacterium]
MTQPRKRAAGSTGSAHARRDGRGSPPSPARIARSAAEQLTEIMGAEADSISGLERTENGWLVRVEVVEVARIPDSTSVLASFAVEVDNDGTLQSYRREQRYYRNQASDS